MEGALFDYFIPLSLLFICFAYDRKEDIHPSFWNTDQEPAIQNRTDKGDFGYLALLIS